MAAPATKAAVASAEPAPPMTQQERAARAGRPRSFGLFTTPGQPSKPPVHAGELATPPLVLRVLKMPPEPTQAAVLDLHSRTWRTTLPESPRVTEGHCAQLLLADCYVPGGPFSALMLETLPHCRYLSCGPLCSAVQ